MSYQHALIRASETNKQKQFVQSFFSQVSLNLVVKSQVYHKKKNKN